MNPWDINPLFKIFKNSTEGTVTLYPDWFICIIMSGEALHEFDFLKESAGSTTKQNLTETIQIIGKYLFSSNTLSDEEHAMYHSMWKVRNNILEISCVSYAIICVPTLFPELDQYRKIEDEEINKLLLHSVPNWWKTVLYTRF